MEVPPSIALLAVCCLAGPAEGGAPSLAEAQAHLDQWQKTFVSIRIHSRRTSRAESNVATAEANHKVSVSELDFVWEDSGRFRDASQLWHDGRPGSYSFRSADSRYYYPCVFAAGSASEYPAVVSILPRTSEFTSLRALNQPFWVLWDDDTRTWLGDRLRNVAAAEVTTEGLLEIDGDAVNLKEHTVRLDPRHGYLPKSAKHRSTGILRYHVEEFQEVQPGFWFPKRGTILTVVSKGDLWQTWEVVKVELNPELPDSLFVPSMNAETRILDSITGKKYFAGGKRRPGQAAAATQRSGAPPTNPNPLTSRPERPTNWSLWFTMAGVACLALAVWFRRRARHP
uniref:Uncharacterized protein n=1 Tax=Schlesneria paludicola TaxID=360056 RepID=A0A7C4LJI8_9PLAN